MTSHADFIVAHTRRIAPPVVPEVVLQLAADAHDIFQAAHDTFGEGPSQHPYWAFAWPGGQALARYLLDNRGEVAGRSVLDLGAGSGLGAIAAAKAGARVAVANDIDPVACEAARTNAGTNGVTLGVSSDDLLGGEAGADVILIGDTFYLPELQMRITPFLQAARRAGSVILFGDRTTIRRPPLDFTLVAEHEASVAPMLDDDHFERARVWRCG